MAGTNAFDLSLLKWWAQQLVPWSHDCPDETSSHICAGREDSVQSALCSQPQHICRAWAISLYLACGERLREKNRNPSLPPESDFQRALRVAGSIQESK